MKTIMKTNKFIMAMAGAALLGAGAAQGDIVLSDDFNDGVIDTSKWQVLDANSVTITEAGGLISGTRTDPADRGYISSLNGWDPSAGALTISGRATFGASASLVIWTRSSGEYDSDGQPNGTGVIGSGIRMSWFTGGTPGFGAFEKDDTVWPWVNIGTTGTIDSANLTNSAGEWDFVVTDDGSVVTLTVASVADPSNTGSISVATTFDPAVTSNRVVLAMNPDVDLDVITIDVVPEPSSLALLGLGGLLMARRRRAQ